MAWTCPNKKCRATLNLDAVEAAAEEKGRREALEEVERVAAADWYLGNVRDMEHIRRVLASLKEKAR